MTAEARGARRRIDLLVEPGSFVEYGRLAEPEDRVSSVFGDVPALRRSAAGDGVVAGFARVGSHDVVLVAFDSAIAGGTYGAVGAEKMRRMAVIAEQRGMPLVMLLEGGGHRVQDGIRSRDYGADDVMVCLARLSGWVPVVAAITGVAFGAPANFAAMADFVVMVRGRSSIGIAGPTLVKAATGDDVSVEELGGAATQVDNNGVAHLAVDTEGEAMRSLASYLAFLPSNSGLEPPTIPSNDPADRRATELNAVVPESTRRAYDVREVVRAIVDEGSLLELQPTYAGNMVTAFGRIAGRPVGILANQPMVRAGTLDVPAVEKATHFVTVCDAFGVALISLIDVPGVLVGRSAEASGLARKSGRLVHAMARTTVPVLSVVLRKAYGLGYAAMAGGRTLGADLALAWPSAQITAMNVEGAIGVAFRRYLAEHEEPDAERARLIEVAMAETAPDGAAAAFLVDDVIEPSLTRAHLALHLRNLPTRSRPALPGQRTVQPL